MVAVLGLQIAHRSEHRVAGAGQRLGSVAAEAGAGASDQDCLGHDWSPFQSTSGGLGGAGLFRQLAPKEIADYCRDLRSLAFEREMTGFEQVDFGVRMVSLERLRAGGQEKGIVLTPYGEERRPLGGDVFLEFGVERDIALIVANRSSWISSLPGRASSAESKVQESGDSRSGDGTPCVYCHCVVSGFRKARSAARFSAEGFFQ